MRHRIAAALIVSLAASAASAQEGELRTPDQKAVYALGVLQARELESLLFTPAELEIFQQGLADGFGGTLQVPFEEQLGNVWQFRQARARAGAAREREEAAAFVARAADESGAVRTESGLVFTSLQEGDGRSPTAADTVTVHYHGTLRDGTTFDSSVARGQPATFPLNGVIPCWTEALQRMSVGSKARLVCPSGIAYGERGFAPLIRPNAALVFEVELLAIQ